LQSIIAKTDCFARQVRIRGLVQGDGAAPLRFVPTHEARVEILDHVYCEAKRDPSMQLPPDLVLALIEVESRFNSWAVSPAGAVGLMQVMPSGRANSECRTNWSAWPPTSAWVARYCATTCASSTMTGRARSARYNGSVGRNTYPALVMQRWQHGWRF